jgi:N6-adenosine-specific RNA methylase IME4
VDDVTLYRTIVADPPWQYGAWGIAKNGPNSSRYIRDEINHQRPMPYPTMTVREICALPVRGLAAEDCDLYLWTTQHYLRDAFAVLDAWGFKYCQTLTWCKTPRGKGQGGLFTPTTEFVLLGRKGRMPKKERIDSTWWNVKRPHNSHSTKPDFFLDLIESVSDAPRLEMFARRARLGWDVWGNEVESTPAVCGILPMRKIIAAVQQAPLEMAEAG